MFLETEMLRVYKAVKRLKNCTEIIQSGKFYTRVRYSRKFHSAPRKRVLWKSSSSAKRLHEYN